VNELLPFTTFTLVEYLEARLEQTKVKSY